MHNAGMKRYFSARSLIGTLLLLVLVGEPTVAMANGLFTLPGLSALLVLYFCLFHLYEALIIRYSLVAWQMVLLNFGIYAVLVTGLLHAEIADYVLRPQDHFITSLIRLQCSLFPVLAFYLLNRWLPRKEGQAISLRASLGLFIGFTLAFTVLSSAAPALKSFGWRAVVATIQTAPYASLAFIAVAVAFAVVALRRKAAAKHYTSPAFTMLALGCLVLASIPGLGFFIALLVVMPLGLGLFFWQQPDSRYIQL
jgi:hypothetical protein